MSDLVEFTSSSIILSSIYENMKSNLITVAILGCARKGKSTFLNSIISFLSKEDVDIFTTSNEGVHCTHGIKYHIIDKYLFIDCEGIMKDDSKNDVNLLLITYSIADFIIFNDTDDFNNSSIAQLTGLCSFSDSMSTRNKPVLIIRIANYELSRDISLSLHNTLEIKREDSFQGTRESIKQLFATPIHIIQTPCPERLERRKLNDKNYRLEIFKPAVDYIINLINKRKTNNTLENIYENLKLIISNLNDNKINIKELDITNMIQEKHINEYISSIPKEIFYPIVITTGFTEEYENNIKKRHLECREILDKFSELFENIQPELYKKKYDELFKKLFEEIKKAEDESRAIYKKIKPTICAHINQLFKDEIIYINDYIKNYDYNDLNIDYIYSFNKEKEDLFIKKYIIYYYAQNLLYKIRNKIEAFEYLIQNIIDVCINRKNTGSPTTYKYLWCIGEKEAFEDHRKENISNRRILEEHLIKILKAANIRKFIDDNAIDPTQNMNENICIKFDALIEEKNFIIKSIKIINKSVCEYKADLFVEYYDNKKLNLTNRKKKIIDQLIQYTSYYNKIIYTKIKDYIKDNAYNNTLFIKMIRSNPDVKFYRIELEGTSTYTFNDIYIYWHLFNNKSNIYLEEDIVNLKSRINDYKYYDKLFSYIMQQNSESSNLYIINFNKECVSGHVHIEYYINKLTHKIIKHFY